MKLTTHKNKQIEALRTTCCQDKYERLSRANYRCAKCGDDVSMEFILMVNAIMEE